MANILIRSGRRRIFQIPVHADSRQGVEVVPLNHDRIMGFQCRPKIPRVNRGDFAEEAGSSRRRASFEGAFRAPTPSP
jgi:hypothetical protein